MTPYQQLMHIKEYKEMTPYQQLIADYSDKATTIRSGFGKFKTEMQTDKSRTQEYVKKAVDDGRKEASQAMSSLHREFSEKVDALTRKMVKQAFTNSTSFTDNSSYEYLSMMNQADKMDHQDRLRFAKNAVVIGSGNAIRAIAHSAFNANDSKTLEYIIDNAHGETNNIKALMEHMDEVNQSNSQKFGILTTFSVFGA